MWGWKGESQHWTCAEESCWEDDGHWGKTGKEWWRDIVWYHSGWEGRGNIEAGEELRRGTRSRNPDKHETQHLQQERNQRMEEKVEKMALFENTFSHSRPIDCHAVASLPTTFASSPPRSFYSL